MNAFVSHFADSADYQPVDVSVPVLATIAIVFTLGVILAAIGSNGHGIKQELIERDNKAKKK